MSSDPDQRVYELRKKVALLREKTIQSQIDQLKQENGKLKQEISTLKSKYESALLANGRSVSLLTNAVRSLSSEPEKTESKSNEKTAKDATVTEQTGKKDKSKKEKPAKEKAPSKPVKEEAPIDVSKLDLRIGYIREVSRHPDADSLYVEQIECGDEPGNEGGFGDARTVCSGLVKHMKEEDLLNKLVVVMCNLKPAKMRGVTSQGMVMCATPGDESASGPELLDPPPGAKAGDRVICKEYPGQPEEPFMNPKKKIWETLKPELRVDEHGVVRYKEAPLEVDGKGLLTAKSRRNCPVS